MTSIVVLCALATSTVVVRREFLTARVPPTTAESPPQKFRDWRVLADGGTKIGPGDAPVVITEFADFQCPYCRRFASTFRDLAVKYPGQIVLSYRHFPLERIHPHARSAAYAAECAAREGRFEHMHDLLLSEQDSIGLIAWQEIAQRAGVENRGAFSECMTEASIIERVEADISLGRSAEIRGTPTVFVNEWRLVGAPSMALLDSLVGELLRKSSK
jgi:protein-disulfide isomerase